MINYVIHVKDSINNNYLGIKIDKPVIEPFLKDLFNIIGEKDFERFTELQQVRDNGEYHLTLINVADYNHLSKEMGIDKFVSSLDYVFKYPIDDLKMVGIGTAEKNTNRSYFIVCESDKLDAIRNRYNLSNKDFHITIGFSNKDVFGVRKNKVIEKEGKFLKLLNQEFYKGDNWDFIRGIRNFELDTEDEIIPVDITNNKLKVKYNGYYMDIVYLEDDESFYIMSKYPIDKDKELPRMSETEISKILN